MKNLITIIIMLVAVGCGNEMRMVEDANTMLQTELEKSKTENKKLQSQNKKLKAELKEGKRKLGVAEKMKEKEARAKTVLIGGKEEKLVGSYKAKKEETTVKLVLLENGKSEHWVNGEKKGEATWKLVEKEVHVLGRKRLFFGDGEDARVYKIEPNGDLTWIANIRGGKREDVPSEEQFTFKKLK